MLLYLKTSQNLLVRAKQSKISTQIISTIVRVISLHLQFTAKSLIRHDC